MKSFLLAKLWCLQVPLSRKMKMQYLKLVMVGLLCCFAASPMALSAATWSQTWEVSTAIPDSNDVGFNDLRNLAIPEITEIQTVTVNLNFANGWNGDLYSYLTHDTGFAVLLNRPGRSLSNSDGSGTSGMNITFDDAAGTDLHTAIPLSGGPVEGAFQPSGRNIDPLLVLDSDPRTALLDSFLGLDPSGTWNLFVADQSAGDTSTLESWTLTITGVPEPSAYAALLGLAAAAACLLRRRR